MKRPISRFVQIQSFAVYCLQIFYKHDVMRGNLSRILIYCNTITVAVIEATSCASHLVYRIAIPDFFSNPGISGLKNANPGIPGLSPGLN